MRRHRTHKADIIQYYSTRRMKIEICYAIQREPHGLCDAIFCPLPFIGAEEEVVVALPDTIWFPADALSGLGGNQLSFLLFPVRRP